ncbi:hypothetical protein NQ036_03750 [Brevibacterium sp. 91QC2O2]|uniref:hypothetical protein n=1 Tax=Brevibacterium TaxID=1696 RepID=UPI00211BE591|nr:MULTISPECIES: hypothetical protein [unclassified Brevibacterium]MCQ9367361.1 hypothetical protein [Brevibacterium sp. 91QC2O2]MCQ9384626.1 hypothetical protein [Brevibacterium sp. 68QC2CO]
MPRSARTTISLTIEVPVYWIVTDEYMRHYRPAAADDPQLDRSRQINRGDDHQ